MGLQSVSQNRSVAGRAEMIEICSKIFQDFTWLGVGSGNYAIFYEQYREGINLASSSVSYYAPNFYIQLIIELGLVGVGIVIIILFINLKEINKFATESQKMILAITLLSLLLREITFSSLYIPRGARFCA
jgi:O-antigen ligase